MQARPPGIYKEHYLHELAGRYADGNIGSIVAPALPDWCFEEDEVDSRGDGQGGKGEEGQDRKGKKRRVEQNNDVSIM